MNNMRIKRVPMVWPSMVLVNGVVVFSDKVTDNIGGGTRQDRRPGI